MPGKKLLHLVPTPTVVPPNVGCDECMDLFDQELLLQEFGGDPDALAEYQRSEEYRERREQWREDECGDVCGGSEE